MAEEALGLLKQKALPTLEGMVIGSNQELWAKVTCAVCHYRPRGRYFAAREMARQAVYPERRLAIEDRGVCAWRHWAPQTRVARRKVPYCQIALQPPERDVQGAQPCEKRVPLRPELDVAHRTEKNKPTLAWITVTGS